MNSIPGLLLTVLQKGWEYYRHLSLHIAFGAVACQAMVFRLRGLGPDVYQLSLLFGAVVLIYLIDHLSDVQAMPHLPLSGRHRFFYRYGQTLRRLGWLLALSLGVGSWFLPWKVLLLGGLIGL
jgi:hypothetical protein